VSSLAWTPKGLEPRVAAVEWPLEKPRLEKADDYRLLLATRVEKLMREQGEVRDVAEVLSAYLRRRPELDVLLESLHDDLIGPGGVAEYLVTDLEEASAFLLPKLWPVERPSKSNPKAKRALQVVGLAKWLEALVGPAATPSSMP
jgi:hypothetical protein